MDTLKSIFDFVKIISDNQDSTVFLIQNKSTGDKYFLKTFKERSNTSETFVDRKIYFRKEINIVSSLNHQNIVKLADTQFDGNSYYLIYPYRSGKTLTTIFNEKLTFSPSDSIKLILQLLEALEYIHLRGIIHCDINPNNIFVDDEKGVTLLDFGNALTEEEAVKLPEGRIVGTLPYLSLEQLGFTDYTIDARSDLFCAALILYQLLSGRLPYVLQDNSVEELLNLILKTEVQPIKDLTAICNAIVLKALKPSPDDRYQTATGFKYDLKVALKILTNKPVSDFEVGKKDTIVSVNRIRHFVARESEISALEKGLDQLSKGSQLSFLLYGKSGIGKTFLINQFRNKINENRNFFLSAKCNRFTPTQPYSIYRFIIMEFLHKISFSFDPDIEQFRKKLNLNLLEHSGLICSMIPELKEYFTEIKSINIIKKNKEADRIIHVLTQLLETICTIKPLIFFIDDIQWLDQTTFSIISNIVNSRCKCMIILNYRTEKDSDDVYLHNTDLKKIGISYVLPIKQFTKKDIKELIFSRFGDIESSEILVDILFEKTDATPFTLIEAIRHLVNNSILRTDNSNWRFHKSDILHLPDRFDTVSLILSKCSWLTNEEKNYLNLASLFEGKFERNIIEKLGTFDKETSKSISHRLENFGFIIRQVSGGYTFTHDKIKEAVIQQIPKECRFTLYEQLGGIYESLIHSNKEYLFNATECYLKSNNLSKSIELCYKAAQYAVEKVAFDIAIHYFKFTMLMASQCPNIELPVPVDITSVQMDFGSVLMLSGKNQQALTIFLKLLKESPSLSENQILSLKYSIGSIYHNMGEFQNSISYFNDSLTQLGIRLPSHRGILILILVYEILRQLLYSFGLKHFIKKQSSDRTKLAIKILNKLSFSLFYNDMLLALVVHFKVLNLADRVVYCHEKAVTYLYHSVASFQTFLKRRAFCYLNKSDKIAGSITRDDLYAFIDFFKGLLFYYYAKWDISQKCLEKSIKSYKNLGDFWSQLNPLETIALIAHNKGDFKQCEDIAQQELIFSERYNDQRGIAVAKRFKMFYTFLKDSTDCNSWTSLEAIKQQIDDSLVKATINSTLATIHLLKNQVKSAYALSTESLAIIKQKSLNQEYIAPTYSLYCEILIQEKRNRQNLNAQLEFSDSELLKELSDNSRKAYFQGIIYPAHMGAALRSRAWYHSFRGKEKRAKKLFLKAIRKHHALDMRYEEAKSLRDYGLFLETCNLPGDARDQFNAAFKLFHLCGAKFDTDLLRNKADYDTSLVKLEEVLENNVSKKPTTTIHNVKHIRVDTLYEVSSSLTGIDDIDLLFKQILNAMIRATGAQYAWLFLQSSERYDTKELCIDFHGKIHHQQQIPFSRKIVQQVKEQKKVVLIRDVSQETSLLDNNDDTSRIDIIRSVLCVPLCHLENYLGCVYLGNNLVSGLFTEESKKIVQILSAQAGVLLENAYLMDEYKKLNKYLQQKVNEQTKDIREKNNQLITYNLKLVESERMKNILTGTIVHDIKNYAAGIEGNVSIINRKNPENHTLKRSLGFINNTCFDIVNLTSNLLDIGRMEESKLEAKKEQISYEHIRKMIDKFKDNELLEERGISVEVVQPLDHFAVDVDVYLLSRVFQNLISNAAKYAPKDGRVIISMESGLHEDIICFFSSGLPIPDKDKQIIFDKYSRVEEKRTLYSKGLGLFFCKLVAQAHQGKIWLETDEQGNYFKISFAKSLEPADQPAL